VLESADMAARARSAGAGAIVTIALIHAGSSAFAQPAPARPPLSRGWAELFASGMAVPLALAWIALAVGALAVGGPLLLRKRRDGLLFALLFLAALALRLWAPLGPLDFCEGQRLGVLWDPRPELSIEFGSMQLVATALRAIGLPAVAVHLGLGPPFGALGVALTFALARAGGLGRGSAALAALVAMLFPAHLRYSAASVTIVAPTLAVAAFAIALSPSIAPPWRIALSASCVVAAGYARSELLWLAPALVPLAFTDGWTWQRRIVLAALLALGLLPWLLAPRAPSTPTFDRFLWSHYAADLAYDWRLNPTWWFAAALVGLALGRMATALRLALVLLFAGLVPAYVLFGTEHNPLWGEWRYLVELVPFAAVAAAALLERAAPRRWPLAIGYAAALGAAPFELRAALRPVDAQVEYAYLRESAPRVAARRPELLLVTLADVRDEDLDEPGSRGVPYGLNAAMAISMALGHPLDEPLGCAPAGDGSPRLRSLGALADCPPGASAPLERSALFLGLFRPPTLVARLERRFELVPIEERRADAAPTLQHLDSQCLVERGLIPGSSLPDCPLVLGWYELRPRR